ncbi:metallophosphoesterase [Campylobacter sp. JMF_01 NE2]|uniref:metallophosphoesterase family protein n=1 Tax=unclassified Campylobacter TaxID=2593542 RepID=UPI0022E9FEAA|nr:MULTISPECIES: metallophosphoesterase [unclassified Campylobacter]MDA3051929.1 metallophosphoesterase [Campylobacter sp. JMF_03 NE3]MDA3066263.1 metallophosphoesterase [Campylobacter sp. JMF_01 NE2]
MNRIFITGDTHGGWRGFSGEMARFKKFEKFESALCKDDFLIIAGDFGFVWNMFQSDAREEQWLKYFNERKFTTLFIDGNHENFDRLNAYEISEFAGDKVHKISQSVYHLMRGQVYEIAGRKIFTMGGALSIDRDMRELGVSWWEGEMISQADICEANANLAKHGFNVDIIITHTCPRFVIPRVIKLSMAAKIDDINSKILQDFYDKIEFKKWYFGHFHEDFKIDDKFRVIYQEIEEIRL